MNLTIIAAIGKNNELGYNNDLIWKFEEDMQFFKDNTMNKKIVMGRKTLESLPKLLDGRTHLVITRNKINDNRILTFDSIDSFLEYADKLVEEILKKGGASIYKELLPHSNKLLLTEIDANSKADAFFPTIDQDDWIKEELSNQEENNIKYKHVLYKKRT